MIISLLHDSKDIPFWGAYECRFGSIGTLNRHFGTLVRPQRKNRMELSRSRFVLLRRLRMAFLSPFFFASAQSEQVRLCTRLSENVFPDCPKNGSPQLPDTGICSVRKSSHASFAGYGRRCDSEKDSPESYSR